MAPNLAYALYLVLPTAIPLWSVGVEEQFYLIWPHIAKFFKDLLTPLIALFFLFQGVKTYAFYQYEANSPINFMISLSRFNIIFIGAFGALMYASKSKILQVIYRKEVQIIAWIVLLGSIIFTSIHIHPLIDHEINAVFYLIIILNIATNPKTLIQLENKLFNAIGKISYGIYVYHMLILYALAIAIEKWSITLNYPLLYLLIPIATLCVSWLSYTFFETPILKYKKKFAIIKT